MHFFCLFSLLAFTTNCVPEFQVLGATDNYSSTTIWINMNVGGECSFSELHQISVDEKGKATLLRTRSDSAATAKFVASLEKISFQKIAPQKGIFTAGKAVFSAPPSDTALLHLAEKYYYSSRWDSIALEQKSDMPVFRSGTAKLISYLPEGIYSNYSVGEAWFSEQTGLLLVITRFDPDISSDKQHGYLLFSLPVEKK